MNIKVAAITVSEKSSNIVTKQDHDDIYLSDILFTFIFNKSIYVC